MKLDGLSNKVYVVAINEARLQGHEYVTPEHFLYAALMFDVGKTLIENSGGRVQSIINDISGFFDTKLPRKLGEAPIESFEFVRLFELATAQANSSGSQIVSLGSLLASLFNLQESYALYILNKNGVDRLSLLKNIAHGMHSKKSEEAKGQKTADKEKEFLQSFTINLTDLAQKGQLDPVIGREDVLSRTIQVLCRRLKNNPIHVGDPGVGKTAVVEGLADRIVSGFVPRILLDAQVFYLDMGALLAGTRYRGDFEERLVKLLDILSKMKNPIIYIDEIHTVVGAGSVSGGGVDATSLIKPYLSKGAIRFIGSTTHEEYKKFFDKDRALSRRFSRIDINEPDLEECVQILQGVKHKYESYHNVVYTDDIIRLICELASKHIHDRHMPDKAIDVMDEAGSYIRAMNDCTRTQAVSVKDIERTVSSMAKIPESTVSSDEIARLKNLENELNSQVFGQEPAVETVVNAIKSSRSGLNDPEKPVANLLFVGPTGVGKTEIAKQLSASMGIKLIRFDMSEYQEKHSVARLIGSPPGYVGYEEGGLLTDAIRKTPHSVLLLDEIEKAHGDILNVLLQIMDYGSLTDNTGKRADFRNVIIIMTSNAGAKEINKRIIGFDEKTNIGAMDKEIERVFSPEFRNRLDAVVVFNRVNERMAKQIAVKALNRLAEKLDGKKITLKPSSELISFVAEKGLSELYGAREIIRVVENDIKKLLVNEVLFGKLSEGGIAGLCIKDGKISVRIKNSEKVSREKEMANK